MDIRNVEPFASFATHVSSAELMSIGIVGSSIKEQQESCLAERLNSVLKVKNDSDVGALLDGLFSDDVELNFDEALVDWWSAVRIIRASGQYIDLQELVELLRAAFVIVDASIPSRSSEGTILGNTLTTRHRGSMSLNTGRARLDKAVVAAS